MWKNYNKWISESLRELISAGRIKKLFYKIVVNWINKL